MLDAHGVPAISLTQVAEVTALVRPSLAVLVEQPFGLTLGAVGDADAHRRIVRYALEAAYGAHPPGTILDAGERWTRDDERERQLLVEG